MLLHNQGGAQPDEKPQGEKSYQEVIKLTEDRYEIWDNVEGHSQV